MKQPSNFIQYDFRIPEAQSFADLHIASGDMRRARVFFAGMSPHKEWMDQEACWIAGVIAYARPFGTGSLRWNKAGLLDELGEESRKWHDHVLDLRSGYLAHSVGSWEGSYPTVEVAQSEDGSMWVEGIKCGGGRIASASSRWQNQSIDLVDEVTKLLSAMIEVERSALKTLAASWPIEHIIARGTIGGRGTRPGPNPRLPPRKPYQG